jgi:hypothetical protein
MDRWLNFEFLLDVPIEDIFTFHFVVVIGYSLADSIVLDFIVVIQRYLDALLFFSCNPRFCRSPRIHHVNQNCSVCLGNCRLFYSRCNAQALLLVINNKLNYSNSSSVNYTAKIYLKNTLGPFNICPWSMQTTTLQLTCVTPLQPHQNQPVEHNNSLKNTRTTTT